MSHPLLAILGALCFGTGWWIDACVTKETRSDSPRNASRSVSRPSTGAATSPPKHTKHPTTPDPIHSAEDLLKLVIPPHWTASTARLERAIKELSDAELAALAEGLKKYPEAGLAQEVVMKRWIELNPAEAIDFFLNRARFNINVGDEIEAGITKVYNADPATALRLLTAMRKYRSLYIFCRARCIDCMEGMSPQEGLAAVVDLDEKTGNDDSLGAQALGSFPGKWIESDPETAMTWALRLPLGFTRRNMLSLLGGAWAEKDPAAVQAFLESVPLTTLSNGEVRKCIAKTIQERKAVPK